MAKQTRVHILAKELGVTSKAIIDKCRAEGIELKNHMAAIPLGLAESIREWFSVGSDVTSVEVAERVDLERARKGRRKHTGEGDDVGGGEAIATAEDDAGVAHETTSESESEAAGEAGTAVLEVPAPASTEIPDIAESAPALEPVGDTISISLPPAEPEPVPEAPAIPEIAADERLVAEAPAPVLAEPAIVEPEPVSEGEPPAGAAEPLVEAPPSPIAPPPPPLVAKPQPPAPPPVRPAGPQVVPAPAELRGPKVVRIEAPEPTRTPRPRTAARAPFGGGGTGGAVAAPPAPGRRPRGKGRKGEEEEAASARARSPRRHGTAVDIDQREREWREQDLLERQERLAAATGHGLRDRRAAERRRQATPGQPATPAEREPISIITPIMIKEFCSAIGVTFSTVAKKLLESTGRLWRINEMIDADQAEIVALDLGVPIQVQKAKSAYEKLEEEFAQRPRPNLQPRPPVVAMLGHVDHGKTSLLDAIRKTHVAAGEAGGITQHIGAYRVDQGEWHVTFIDTPGHEAFTAMRARGANLTDVVVLVVAADDGVMPQTVEAIAHARAAKVAIVIALNKIDLPGIDLNRVYAQLAEQGLTPTEWGGETDVLKTSATGGTGISELLTHLSTLSELLDLKADPTVPVLGSVIEAQMQEGRGVVAQVLVREGTLRPGQTVVCGPGSGRVRALRDAAGRMLTEASPGTPVEVSGLDELPTAGDRLFEVEPSRAKDIAKEVREQRRAATLVATPKPRTLEALLQGEADGELPELNVIVKADVQGSVEVLRKKLSEFPTTKARLKLLLAGVGAITEADVNLAKTSSALIVGFHIVPEDRARQLADQLGVEIRTYRVIYEMLDDLRKALVGLLEPLRHEEVRGAAAVQKVFSVSRVGTIAGCRVTDGVIHRAHHVRLIRDGRVIVENKPIASLKHFKDDAREVRAGLECGIKIQDFDDLKPGDVVQAFEMVAVAQEL